MCVCVRMSLCVCVRVSGTRGARPRPLSVSVVAGPRPPLSRGSACRHCGCGGVSPPPRPAPGAARLRPLPPRPPLPPAASRRPRMLSAAAAAVPGRRGHGGPGQLCQGGRKVSWRGAQGARCARGPDAYRRAGGRSCVCAAAWGGKACGRPARCCPSPGQRVPPESGFAPSPAAAAGILPTRPLRIVSGLRPPTPAASPLPSPAMPTSPPLRPGGVGCRGGETGNPRPLHLEGWLSPSLCRSAAPG